MKRWLVLLLFIITATGTFTPCCGNDACCADEFAAASKNEERKTEGACSPFFACATCPGSVELSRPVQIIHPTAEKPVYSGIPIVTNLATYAASFWQPPRFC